MPRTFTLQRLMLAVTLFCLLCGLLVNYPQVRLPLAVLGCYGAPTVLVCGALMLFSRRRSLLVCNIIFGALLGLAVFSPMWTAGPPGLWAEDVLLALTPALGALALGVAELVGDHGDGCFTPYEVQIRNLKADAGWEQRAQLAPTHHFP